MEYKKLSNGFEMPKVILGTHKTKGEDFMRIVADAYEAGYKAIDSAAFYQNEKDIGDAMKKLGVRLSITTKVWNDMHGYKNAIESFEQSEENLGGVDVLLIHWPGKDKFIETWSAFEELYEKGRVKAIGVSNFLVHHLETLKSNCKIMPMINQIETHICYLDIENINYCKQHGISVEAWRPLMQYTDNLSLPDIVAVAKAHNKTSAQVAIRYLMQKDIIVLPKSVHRNRIFENIDVFDFEITEEEMALLEKLNTGKRTGADPDTFF